MGDYMGIAAYGGKVYGIWTRTATPEEQPPATTPAEAQPADSKKDTPAEKTEGDKPTLSLAHKGLFVEVGLADFSTATTTLHRHAESSIIAMSFRPRPPHGHTRAAEARADFLRVLSGLS